MPIHRHHRWLYPIDWRELSASIRFRRAKGGANIAADPTARRFSTSETRLWWDEERHTWRNGRGRPVARLQAPDGTTATRTTRVVLATAHLDHNPMNNHPRNLAALCQRCHILHDKEEEHRRRRWITYRMRRALGDLFTGPYR